MNGNNISHFIIISENFTKKDRKNRESSSQTIPSSWDFSISFPNKSGLLFKMVLLDIEFLSVYHFMNKIQKHFNISTQNEQLATTVREISCGNNYTCYPTQKILNKNKHQSLFI